MPRLPLGLQDNDPADAVMASNVEAWLQDTYDQAIRDGGGGTNVIDVTDHGIQSTSAGLGLGVSNSTAWDVLITTLSSNSEIVFPAGTYDFNGGLTAISNDTATGTKTAVNNIMIRGAGMGVTILRQEATSATGRFFTMGNAIGAQTGRVTVKDLSLQCLNAPSPGTLPDNSPAFYVQNMGNFTIENIHCNGISSFLRVGVDATDTNNSHGGYVNNIFGTQQDAGGRSIHLRRCASAFFQNIELHVAGGTDVGIPLLIEPAGGPSPAAVEGIWFDNCILFSVPPGAVQTAAGQVAGVRIDHTAGAVSNIWFTNCNWDFSSVAGVDIVASSGAFNCRYMKFQGCYMGLAGGGPGNAVRIQNNGTGVVVSPQFTDCFLGYGPGRLVTISLADGGDNVARRVGAVTVSGSGTIQDVGFYNNQVVDTDLVNTKTAAFSFAKGSFTLKGNFIRGFDTDATNTTYAVETTAAGMGHFTVVGNRAEALASSPAQFFNHFAYTSQLHSSQGRIVASNWPDDGQLVLASATTLNIPPGAQVAQVTGTTAITSIQGQGSRLVTLQFTGNCTVTAGATIHLAAAFTSTVHDTLTLMSTTGNTWWECSRSVNT